MSVTLAMCTCAQPLPLAVVALFCTIPDRPQQTTEPDWEAERLHWGDSPESLNLKVRPSCQVRDQRIKVLREMKVEQAMVFGQCGRISWSMGSETKPPNTHYMAGTRAAGLRAMSACRWCASNESLLLVVRTSTAKLERGKLVRARPMQTAGFFSKAASYASTPEAHESLFTVA